MSRSDRSDTDVKPRYPRLHLLGLRRKVEAQLDTWHSVADEDGLVHIVPGRRR
jgi:hypothetical protein